MGLFWRRRIVADTARGDEPVPVAPAVAKPGLAYEPVAGVSIELYAAISRGLAADGFDQSHAPQIAASHGVASETWKAAVAGWNERIRADPALAAHFNARFLAGAGAAPARP